MKRAFTLIELVVSVGILALVISFSGVVFKISIESYRIAGANAEIMQKLRAITDQLNADFKGIRRDAPLLLWFQQDPCDPNQRYDQIMFFANGDFQSTQLYDVDEWRGVEVPALTGDPVRGNLARIYYGQAMAFAPSVGDFLQPWQQQYEDAADSVLNRHNRILARRQHIFSADPALSPFPDVTDFVNSFNPTGNDYFEHDSISLAEWKVISDNFDYNKRIVLTCFDANRPHIDLVNMSGVHMLMAQQVSSFSIQWAYFTPAGLRWFPTNFDFGGMGLAEFGIYFNMPSGVDSTLGWYGPEFAGFPPGFFPEALRFTFTLYDSRGILGGGRTFTHIVHLRN